MVYTKKNSENNAECGLSIALTTSSLVMFASGNFDRFSTSDFVVEVSTFDSAGNVTARENMFITSRSWNQFNIWTRAYEAVPIDDTQTTNIQQALAFWTTNTVIKQVISKILLDEIQDELINLWKWQSVYSASSTWNDSYSITIPNITNYIDWEIFRFKADVANIWPATLNVNGMWAIPLKKLQWTVDLDDNDVQANWIVTAVYNSTWPVFQFTWQNWALPVLWWVSLYWNWNLWALVVSWTTNINTNTIYQYTDLTINNWAFLKSLSTSWNIYIKVAWILTVNWVIDMSWINWSSVFQNSLGLSWQFWTHWSWWAWANGWAWAYWWAWWAWWAWSALWYGWWGWWWGGQWAWWAGWIGWTPWWIWWAWWAPSWTWTGWGISAWWGWWGWANFGWWWWNPWVAWWNAYWNAWANALVTSIWTWGWAGWLPSTSSPLIYIEAKTIVWNWQIIANWWAWWAGWLWWAVFSLNWQWWAGWGWWWAGWGSVIMINNVNNFTWSISVAWWAGWTWWNPWWAWTSWTTQLLLDSNLL